jgi:hypothetical protein
LQSDTHVGALAALRLKTAMRRIAEISGIIHMSRLSLLSESPIFAKNAGKINVKVKGHE